MSVYQRPLRSDELMHFGIKGMKWGQRRYQNKDGSYTSIGKMRYSLAERRYTNAAINAARDAADLRAHGYHDEADAVMKVSNNDRRKAAEYAAKNKAYMQKRKKGMSTAKKIAIGAGVAAGIAGAGALGYAVKNKKLRSRVLTGAARAALPGGKSLPAARGRRGKTAMAYMNDIAKRKGDFKLYNKVGKKAKSGLPSVVRSKGSSLATRGSSAVRNGYWQSGLKRVTRDRRPLEALAIGGAAAGAGAAGYAAYRHRKKKNGSKKRR